MPDTMVKKIDGNEYNVMKLSGNPYAPVNQRVEAATKAGGFTVISCEYKVIFERQVCEVWIEYEGRKYPGTTEVKKDFSRPLEDAQTSAIGRALGFAGFDIERAIASAEDMASLDHASVTVESEAPRQLPQRKEPAKVEHKQLPAGEKKPIMLLIEDARSMGLSGSAMVKQFEEWVGKPWMEINRLLQQEDAQAIAAGLTELRQKGKAS